MLDCRIWFIMFKDISNLMNRHLNGDVLIHNVIKYSQWWKEYSYINPIAFSIS